jgi:hypothetical protein
VLNEVLGRTKRKPIAVIHDHGPRFLGHFHRQLHVLEIEKQVTPVRSPQMNCNAERRSALFGGSSSTRPDETEASDLAALRLRRLMRRAYAQGLLQGYALVEADEPRAAA